MADSCGVCIHCEDDYDYYCDHCGEGFYDGGGECVDGNMFCDNCLENNYRYSDYLYEYIPIDAAIEVKKIDKNASGDFYISFDVVGEQELDEAAVLVKDIKDLPDPLPLSLDLYDYVFVDDLDYCGEGRYRFPSDLV